MQNNTTLTKAKRAGRKVKLRTDWEDVKLNIMKELIMIKFQNPLLKEKLLNTGDALLIEGNT
ncbi:MAG: NADAR family protein [Erysipelotrichaceae bacterium]|nr:NADAR family protein [Erysipelotrichaceae bacterium]